MAMTGNEVSEENGLTYWQVSPGRKERGLWPEFKSKNIIAIARERDSKFHLSKPRHTFSCSIVRKAGD
jgi:hypothetical protein